MKSQAFTCPLRAASRSRPPSSLFGVTPGAVGVEVAAASDVTDALLMFMDESPLTFAVAIVEAASLLTGVPAAVAADAEPLVEADMMLMLLTSQQLNDSSFTRRRIRSGALG